MTDHGAHYSPDYPERVVLFGSEGGYSRPVLKQLLTHGISVVAIVMPGVTEPENTHHDIPVTIDPPGPASLAGLVAKHDIPVFRTLDMHEPWLAERLAAITVDIILVACFPLILPATIRHLPHVACWNLHPSLLPQYRGPAPLFWQQQNKERHTGVSLHEVTAQIDAGDIIAQQASPLPAGSSEAELNEWVAAIGVDLFMQALQLHHQGQLVPAQQDETRASYYPHRKPISQG